MPRELIIDAYKKADVSICYGKKHGFSTDELKNIQAHFHNYTSGVIQAAGKLGQYNAEELRFLQERLYNGLSDFINW